ncbi:MAG: bifunctional glutamate N-acetyltransferase/amino-acid acetyltransferase ArgJ [SAR202 cluster bacterium]|nr:bifunctional glutamate N-acetyltransferase/amino-acid acetyltransferase ArgJ [SAR202 cluster bacterium]RZP18551.1 MAG: bifunctional glutamate N-acetyltransferase/amino-acid acetyltransferase ArgJ [Chloroflexota bacterium]|tara:strand:- start:16261 stop:17475 length:1215 start_codon:yes stop_codon:yes gene_type:complete
MESEIKINKKGDICSPKGFLSGSIFSGIKSPGQDKRDIGIIYSESDCISAGTFTQNSVVSPSVTWTKDITSNGNVKAIVANSGCANCAVGEQGLIDAKEMASIAANSLGIDQKEVAVASTGIIGVELPMALMRKFIPEIKMSKKDGNGFARSILTTDTKTKEISVSFEIDGTEINVAGVAKGSGMIHPNMATMLAFITSDIDIEKPALQKILKNSVNKSFNQISVDGDQSTNDTVLLLANGMAKNKKINTENDSKKFIEALDIVCTFLAQEIAKDGEGNTRLIEATVTGAKTEEDAMLASRFIVTSNLVKTAVYGRDPNWGRIIMALGASQIPLDESKIEIFVNDIQIVSEGIAISYNHQSIVIAMGEELIRFKINLNIGSESGVAWGSELTEEYVVFNSAYTT